MECYTYLRNVTDLLSDGKTPYERRFGKSFKGPIISFGSLVEYHPKLRRASQGSINLDRKSRVHVCDRERKWAVVCRDFVVEKKKSAERECVRAETDWNPRRKHHHCRR